VLGASGFIGARVVKTLTDSEWATPICASRRMIQSAASESPAKIRIDATDPQQLAACLHGIDGVVNCITGNDETIIGNARALFGVVAGMSPRPRVVHMSSLAVYGSAEGSVAEADAPGGQLAGYGLAKFAAERLATSTPLPVVILRPGIVYGPGSSLWSGRIASLLRARRLGDLGAAGDGLCNLVYVDDVVSAIVRALRTPNLDGRIFNLSLPTPPTWNEYFLRFAKFLGAVPVRRITARRLRIESKILAPPQKIAQIIVSRISPSLARSLPQPIPPSLIRLFAQEIRMQVDAAESALGADWLDLDEGLRRAASYYSP
jgi:nucleoside-diphosphate-sugar epimerase